MFELLTGANSGLGHITLNRPQALHALRYSDNAVVD